ncbi:MAG: hypothetical protein AAGA30_20190 [Planctomycetota bacterium]
MEANPYQSPREIDNSLLGRSVEHLCSNGTALKFRLVAMETTWFTREAIFEGDFNQSITYDCRGFGCEFVSVGSEKIVFPAKNLMWLDIVQPILEFSFAIGDESIPVRIEVKCSNLLFYIKRFRLTVAGHLLYEGV